MRPRLSHHLRESTRDAHSRLRMGSLLLAYFRGLLDRTVVMEGLAALAVVYGELEERLETTGLHSLAPQQVCKTNAIASDLAGLQSLGWPSPTGPYPAAIAYADHIRGLDDATRLGAHAYARYMGDLAGGPIARRAAPWVLPLPPGVRLAYLELPGVSDLAAFREHYRCAIDALPVTDPELMVDEVLTAFALHHAMVDELWDRFVEPRAAAS